MKLELFKRDTCPFCVRVMRYIEERGVTGQIDLLDITRDEAARERLVREGGKQQVPCLFIDGAPMYESGDIMDWIGANL